MPYTVYRPDGNSAFEFETYVRLLRQSGIDVGNLPRVKEPTSGKNWLYVWSDRERADQFRRKLVEQTESDHWQLLEVDAPPSVGPLGPLIVRMMKQYGQFVFSISPLGRHIVRTLNPAARGVWTLSVPTSTVDELRQENPDYFPGLVRTVLPALTGLSTAELDTVGYAVVNADTEQWEHYSSPAALVAA